MNEVDTRVSRAPVTGSAGRPWYKSPYLYIFTILSLVTIAAATLLSRAALRPFNIPSEAMIPTLKVGDYVYADTLAYADAKPARGDVVFFRLPRDGRTIYVKRIIGLPGETVLLKEGVVYIDGQPLRTVPAGTFHLEMEGDSPRDVPELREALSDGRSYLVLDSDPNGALDNVGPYKVPQGSYFVLGDNRDNSADSRVPYQVGYVPAKNILGKAWRLFWSRGSSRIGNKVE